MCLFWGPPSHRYPHRGWQRRLQVLLLLLTTVCQVWRWLLSHTPGPPWQQRTERMEERGRWGSRRRLSTTWNTPQVHPHNLIVDLLNFIDDNLTTLDDEYKINILVLVDNIDKSYKVILTNIQNFYPSVLLPSKLSEQNYLLSLNLSETNNWMKYWLFLFKCFYCCHVWCLLDWNIISTFCGDERRQAPFHINYLEFWLGIYCRQ